MTPCTISTGHQEGVVLALIDGLTYTVNGRLPMWATHVGHSLYIAGRLVARVTVWSEADGGRTVLEVLADREVT
jgi:hypothetical protein